MTQVPDEPRPGRESNVRWLLAAAAAAATVVAAAAVVAVRSAAEPATIGDAELRALPPLVVVAGAPRHPGEVQIVRPEDASGRQIETWSRLPDPDGELGGPDGVGGVRWAPNRRTIALEVNVWNGDPDTQVALVRSDGRAIRALSGSSWTAGYTAWSPIGSTLAYTYLGGVYLCEPTGSRKRIWQAEPSVSVQGIDWAPDGKHLAVAAGGIVTMTRTGREVKVLTRANDVRPKWSADGKDIFFEGWYEKRDGIFRVSASGGHPRRIVGGGVFSLSPDGSRLLFLKTRGSDATDVYVHDLSTHATHRLTEDGISWPLEWSPDGEKILFRREAWEEGQPKATWQELWVMDRDGGRKTRLPFNAPNRSVAVADW